MKENKTNHKHKDIFCVINSKGGVGKSTVAMQVIAPALYLNHPDKKIHVWEIDNNNKSNKHISSKYLKYESIKLDKSEMAINDIEFSNLTDPNSIHVIDTGGSDDATKILAHLKQVITSPINNLNYSIILYGKNRCKKIITQRVV